MKIRIENKTLINLDIQADRIDDENIKLTILHQDSALGPDKSLASVEVGQTVCVPEEYNDREKLAGRSAME